MLQLITKISKTGWHALIPFETNTKYAQINKKNINVNIDHFLESYIMDYIFDYRARFLDKVK